MARRTPRSTRTATLLPSTTLFRSSPLNRSLVWWMLRAGYALAQAPGSRLLRRSAHTEDRPDVFAAQVALSHARWPGLLFPRRLTRIGRGLRSEEHTLNSSN